MIKVVKALLPFHRHSSERSPAWMQVVEPRLEQAAEESRRAMTEWQTDSGARRPAPGWYDAFIVIPAWAGMS